MARPAGINFLDVRLVNRAGIGDDGKKIIIVGLIKLFRAVTGAYMDMFPDAQFPVVQPTFHENDLRPHDLRCFVLTSAAASVARRLGSPGLGPGGTTFQSRRGWVSEVYDDMCETYEAEVKLIFHELMHNKLQMGNEMHTDFDVGFGLARDQVESTSMANRSTSQLTDRNAKAMARHLFDAVPQYAGN